MAVSTYDTDHDTFEREGAYETASGGVAGRIFLWVAWALAAIFWGLLLTTAVGILRSPATDTGGIGLALIAAIGGLAVVGLAIAAVALRWGARGRNKDAITEASTRAEYDLIEANGGDDEVTRSPEARRPEERDSYRAAANGPIS